LVVFSKVLIFLIKDINSILNKSNKKALAGKNLLELNPPFDINQRRFFHTFFANSANCAKNAGLSDERWVG